jgi:hypothetical protein
MPELIISNKRIIRKKMAIPFILFALLSLFLSITASLYFTSLIFVFALISLYIIIKVNNTYLISYNPKLRKIQLSKKQSIIVIDLENVKNISEGAHFQPRDDYKRTNYYLTLINKTKWGVDFIFTVYDHDKELLKNLSKLRFDFAKIKHERAKLFATLKK